MKKPATPHKASNPAAANNCDPFGKTHVPKKGPKNERITSEDQQFKVLLTVSTT